jgi:hypothetical protein
VGQIKQVVAGVPAVQVALLEAQLNLLPPMVELMAGVLALLFLVGTEAALVAAAQFVLFGPELRDLSHLHKQVICNGTLYSN